MRNFLNCLLLVALFAGATEKSLAFSLLGPFATYQTATLNYASPFTSIQEEGDLGGPMNLGEEYRWGSPVLVYGFDSSFVEYFGPQGVAAIEAAVKILNDLPSTSAMSAGLTEYPLSASRYNYVAQQLRLRDIKSIMLSTLLQAMGLACPERYAWTIYRQVPIEGTTPQQYIYSIIQRNFDPVSFRPTSYVNNTLYTYQILQVGTAPDTWDCQELAVDVSNPNVSVIATAGLQSGVVDPRVIQQVYGTADLVQSGFGLFYTGLTRDDVGAIRYLYRPQNVNWQSAPTGTVGSGAGSTVSPWSWAGFSVSIPNATSPWSYYGGTSLTNAGLSAGSTNFVAVGGRQGPGKVSFVRVDTDPLLGQYLNPVTINYPEIVIGTDGAPVGQVASRTITQPDILFSAADIGAAANTAQPYVYSVNGTTFERAVNPGVSTAFPADGPGIQQPGIQVVLNKVGPWNLNIRNTDQVAAIKGFVWGSFDGTTNAPIVYPQGVQLQELESRLFP